MEKQERHRKPENRTEAKTLGHLVREIRLKAITENLEKGKSE